MTADDSRPARRGEGNIAPVKRRAARPLRLVALLLAAANMARGAEPVAAPAADAPWKVQQTTRAEFPERLVRNGITRGQARVRLSVSAEGRLLDALVVACSERDFGDEALRAVRTWRFEPERVKGVPIGVVATIVFSFVVNGTVTIDRRGPATGEEEVAAEARGYGAAGMRTLDRIPLPAHVVSPAFPDEWRARGITGSAVVEFYIDESGAVRIPCAISATHPELGASAVAAVAQWRFQPPTRRGEPVLVRAEQIFRFDPAEK